MSLEEAYLPKEIMIKITEHLCYVDKINFLYRTLRIYPNNYSLPVDKKIINYEYENTILQYNEFKKIISVTKTVPYEIRPNDLTIPSIIVNYKNIKVLIVNHDVKNLKITKKMKRVFTTRKNTYVRSIFLNKNHNLEYLNIRLHLYVNLDKNFLKIKNIKLRVGDYFIIHIIGGEIIKLDMNPRNIGISTEERQNTLLSFLSKIEINNLSDRKINTFRSKNPISYSNIIKFSNITNLSILDFEFFHFDILNSNEYTNITVLDLCLNTANIDILDFSNNKNIKKLTINNESHSKTECRINENLEDLHLINIDINLEKIKSYYNLNILSLIDCTVSDNPSDVIIIPEQIRSLTFVFREQEDLYSLEVPTELDYLEFSNVIFSNKIKYIRKCNFKNSFKKKLNCEKIDIIEISPSKDNFYSNVFARYDFSIYNCNTFIMQYASRILFTTYEFNFKLPQIMKCVAINIYAELVLENVQKIELLKLDSSYYNEYLDLKKISEYILITSTLYDD